MRSFPWIILILMSACKTTTVTELSADETSKRKSFYNVAYDTDYLVLDFGFEACIGCRGIARSIATNTTPFDGVLAGNYRNCTFKFVIDSDEAANWKKRFPELKDKWVERKVAGEFMKFASYFGNTFKISTFPYLVIVDRTTNKPVHAKEVTFESWASDISTYCRKT